MPEFWNESEMTAKPDKPRLVQRLLGQQASPLPLAPDDAALDRLGRVGGKPTQPNRRKDGYLANIW